MLTSQHSHEAQHGGLTPKCPCCNQVRKVIDGVTCSWHKKSCGRPDAAEERRAARKARRKNRPTK
jgi:hypothetical protein